MTPEFAGIERRLDELYERLRRLEPLKGKSLPEFYQGAYLRDIVERNLEIAAQCCLDIGNRLIGPKLIQTVALARRFLFGGRLNQPGVGR